MAQFDAINHNKEDSIQAPLLDVEGGTRAIAIPQDKIPPGMQPCWYVGTG
jgi:hypothetical protein